MVTQAYHDRLQGLEQALRAIVEETDTLPNPAHYHVTTLRQKAVERGLSVTEDSTRDEVIDALRADAMGKLEQNLAVAKRVLDGSAYGDALDAEAAARAE